MSSSHPISPASEVKHVFSASSFVVVRLEDLKEVADLKADLVACYKPVNSQELLALERMALCQHQIFRGARLEAGLFTSALDEVLDQTGNPIRPMSVHLAGDGDIEIARAQNRNFAAGEGFRRMAKESDNWALLIRFQTHAERQYRRAVEEFERLKKLRSELPNEPNIGTGPEPPEDLLMELTPEPAPWPPPPTPSKAPAPVEPSAAPESNSEIPAAHASQYALPLVAALLALLKGNSQLPSGRRIPRRHIRRRPVHVVQAVERTDVPQPDTRLQRLGEYSKIDCSYHNILR